MMYVNITNEYIMYLSGYVTVKYTVYVTETIKSEQWRDKGLYLRHVPRFKMVTGILGILILLNFERNIKIDLMEQLHK